MLVPYEAAHGLEIINQRRRDCDSWIGDCAEGKEWAERWESSGPAYTFIIDGQVIGCGGVTLQGMGRGEAWTVLSPLFEGHELISVRAIKKKLDDIIHEHKLRRVQAISKSDFEPGARLLEFLGFQEEGELRSFGPEGEDVIIFGRITNG